MFLAEAATKRPVAMACLLIALFGLGLNSYRKLSLENLPATDVPYVNIGTKWIGATPEDMEKNVAKKIEDAVSSLDGLKCITTTCLENFCSVVLEFDLGTDVNTAAVDVREKLDPVLEELPAQCERPVIEKFDINATSVITLALLGDATIEEKYDYVDNVLGDKFSTIPGVGKVEILGGNKREIHVELDREKVIAAGLTTAEIVHVISANINSMPAGTVRENGAEISVKFDAEYKEIPEIGNFEVVSRKGIRRKISDLGRVFLTTDEIRQKVWLDGQECILLSIVKKGEANVVNLVRDCYKRMEDVQDTLPGGMELVAVSDDGKNVESMVSATLSDIISGVILCAVILFIFLGDLNSTLIVCITMPLTIIISLFFIQLSGQTLNTVTLLALGLSVGVLVSNSIVVLENVSMRMEEIPDCWLAAERGTSEMAVSVFASAGTNVVVMLPLTMMWSLVGRVMKPFAVTTLIVNLVSIFISFTLTPMLCAVMMKPKSQRRQNWFTRLAGLWTGWIYKLGEKYSAVISWCSSRRLVCFAALLIAVGVFVLAIFQGKGLGFTLIEEADKGRLLAVLEYPITYDLDRTYDHVLPLAKEFQQEFPDLEHVLVRVGKTEPIGYGDSEGVYLGQISLYFKDKTERDWKISEVVQRVKQRLMEESGVYCTVATPSDLGGISLPINFSIAGDDMEELENIGRKIVDIGKGVPGISMFGSSVREGKPQLLVTPKRTVLRDIGMDTGTLGMLMRGNLDGIEAASFKANASTYDVRVKYSELPGRDQIKRFMMPGTDGKPVLLSSVVELEDTVFPVKISRKDKQRVIWLYGTLAENAALDTTQAEVYRRIEEAQILPPGYTISESGNSEFLYDAILDFGEAIILAAFLTYLTIAAIMESFLKPLLVLLTLPAGLVGLIWGMLLSGWNINILVMLGALMLIGIVVNAAILIMDRYTTIQKSGVPKVEAMSRGAGESFRAVIMVILASSFGMLPIALSTGLGSELRVGIGAASTGGVIVAGIFTMALMPLIHCLYISHRK